MAKDPDARFQSMRELAETLQKNLAGAVAFQAPVETASTVPAPSSASGSGAASNDSVSHTGERPRRKRPATPAPRPGLSPAVMVAAGLGLAALGALGVWVFQTYL